MRPENADWQAYLGPSVSQEPKETQDYLDFPGKLAKEVRKASKDCQVPGASLDLPVLGEIQ